MKPPEPVTTNVLIPAGQTVLIGFAPDTPDANNADAKELLLIFTASVVKSTEDPSSASSPNRTETKPQQADGMEIAAEPGGAPQQHNEYG